MANNFLRAYGVTDDGLFIDGGVHFLSGAASPQGSLNPTVPTVYYQTNNVLWKHNGSAGINGWIRGFDSWSTKMTASQSSTVVAPAELTGLTSQSLAVGDYSFAAYIKMRSAAAATGYGLRFQNVTATVSSIMAAWRLPANVDFSTTQNIHYSQRLLTDNNIAGTIGAVNTDYLAVGEGFFTVSVAGTVTIQLRSETAGTAVTAGIGSCLLIEALP